MNQTKADSSLAPASGASDTKEEGLAAQTEASVLPRAMADVVNEGLSLHGHDEEPVSVVSVITLDRKEIEAIEREFGGQRVHAKEVPFDLLAAPSSNPSPISGSSQPAGQPDALGGSKPE